MKKNYNFKKRMKTFFFLFFFLFIFLYQINFHITEAIAMDNYINSLVIEELRLKVPSEYKEVWLNIEKKFGTLGYLLKMVF